MNRVKDVGSVYGEPQRMSLEHIKRLNKKFNYDYNVLVVDDKDGLHSISFANHGVKSVTMYEPNKNYIYGGEVGGYKITPITNRKNFKKNADRITIVNKCFYTERVEKQYDFVFCYRSLHETCNKKVPMYRKIRKLLSSVKPNGYIYIFYHMAKNENDFSNFSKNQYLREREMIKFFDPEDWDILFVDEFKKNTKHNGHPNHKKTHYHKVGHILAQKKNKRLIHKYFYDIIGVY